MIEIEPNDYIAIYHPDGNEIVRWVVDEWIEDPDIVISIASAVDLYHTKGPDYLRQLVGP